MGEDGAEARSGRSFERKGAGRQREPSRGRRRPTVKSNEKKG
jgi:hypothetical protein